jgi:hypothetical protein
MKLVPILGPLLALCLLSGCTQPTQPSAAPSSFAPVSAPAETPGGTPSTTVVDCGVYTIKQGEGLSEDAMRCVIDAAANGRAARLQETRPTLEGDPITTWYVVRADRVVEVTRDTTKDRFGNAGIYTETCTGPVASGGMLTFAKCDPA